jgi:hypothetical protein
MQHPEEIKGAPFPVTEFLYRARLRGYVYGGVGGVIEANCVGGQGVLPVLVVGIGFSQVFYPAYPGVAQITGAGFGYRFALAS